MKFFPVIFYLQMGSPQPIHSAAGSSISMFLTLIHQDYQDLKLCLEKPGISLQLQNGDVVIFTSSKLSHFNTHFKGKQASLVFHSNISSKAWVEKRNGWKHTRGLWHQKKRPRVDFSAKANSVGLTNLPNQERLYIW